MRKTNSLPKLGKKKKLPRPQRHESATFSNVLGISADAQMGKSVFGRHPGWFWIRSVLKANPHSFQKKHEGMVLVGYLHPIDHTDNTIQTDPNIDPPTDFSVCEGKALLTGMDGSCICHLVARSGAWLGLCDCRVTQTITRPSGAPAWAAMRWVNSWTAVCLAHNTRERCWPQSLRHARHIHVQLSGLV